MPKPNRISWKNGDGSTSTAWQVRYTDRAGRRRSKQFPTKAQGVEFAATVTSAVRAGHVHNRDTVTIAVAAQRWLEACERGRDGRDPVEPHTLRVYDMLVRLHISPFLGSLRLNELTSARVKEFRDADLIDGGRSRSMTRKALGALSAICREAISDGLLAINPCVGVQIVTSSRHKKDARIPSKAEVQTLVRQALQWVENPPKRRSGSLRTRVSRHRALWFYTMLRFLVSTGTRLSEARGAARASLDLDAMVYRVTQRADEGNRIGSPKSAAGSRDLELSAGLVADLKRWLAVAPNSGLIFGNREGKPELAQNIYKRFWLPLLVECGFARRVEDEDGTTHHDTVFSIHDLRHFHASLMIETGMQEKPLQEHMGHSSIKVTMDTYGHLFKDADAKARRRALIVDADAELLPAH